MNEEVNTHRGISNLEPSHQPVFESSSQPIFGHSIHDPTHGPRRPSNESKTLQLLSGQFAKDSIPSRRSEKSAESFCNTTPPELFHSASPPRLQEWRLQSVSAAAPVCGQEGCLPRVCGWVYPVGYALAILGAGSSPSPSPGSASWAAWCLLRLS